MSRGDWGWPASVPGSGWGALGAKLGAILCGIVRTAVDAGGLDATQDQAVWTFLDAYGHRLEIYGSGGWVFESPRARYTTRRHSSRSVSDSG